MGVCNSEPKKPRAQIYMEGVIKPVIIPKPEEKNDPPEDKKSESDKKIDFVPIDMIGNAEGIPTQIINDMYGSNINADKPNEVNDERKSNNENNGMNDDQDKNNSGNNINNPENNHSVNPPQEEDSKNMDNQGNNINNDNDDINNDINNDNNNDNNPGENKTFDNVSNTPIDFPDGQGNNNDNNSRMNGQSSSFINNRHNTKSSHNSQNENNNPDNGTKIYTNKPSMNNNDSQNQNQIKNSVINYKVNINVDNPNQNQSNEQNNNLFNNNQNNELPNLQNNNSNNQEDKNNINKISPQNIINNNFAKNNYDTLDISKTYYMSCPYCKKYQPYIESIEYDTNENDFLITFACPCNSSDGSKKKAYFSSFFVEEEPENKCQIHSNKIAFFCKECQRHTCFNCIGDNHKNHSIYGFGKDKILSKDNRNLILNTIEEKKGIFKGYDIISKLINELDKNTIYSKQENIMYSSKDIINSNNNINNNKINQYNSINPEINNNINQNTMVINNNNANNNNMNMNANNGNNDALDRNNMNGVIDIKSSNYNIIDNINNSINDNNNIRFTQQFLDGNLNQDQGKHPSKFMNPNSNNAGGSQGNIISQNKEVIFSDGYETKVNNNNSNVINNIPQIIPQNNFNMNKTSINLNCNNFYLNNQNYNNEPNSNEKAIKSQNNINIPYNHNNFNYPSNAYNINMNNLRGNPQNNMNNNMNNNTNNNMNNNMNNNTTHNMNNNTKYYMNNNTNNNTKYYMNNNTNNNMNNNNQIEEWANLNQGSNSRMNEYYNNDFSNSQNLDCQYHEVQKLIGHTDKIVSLIELESGHIATGSYDCTIRIWDLKQNISIMSKIERGYVFCLLEFEPNMILAGTSENNINLWDLSSQKNECEFNFMQHTLWVNCLVKCDDNYFASAGNDALICIWDYKNRQLKYVLKGHIDCILALIKLKDGNLCSGSADLTIKIWDWKNQMIISSIKTPHNKWVKCVYQLNNGTLLSGSENICVWTNKHLSTFKTLTDHKHYIRTICQIDDNHFASGSFDKTIKIWNIRDFSVTQTIEAHNSNVICIIKLKENKLASCSNDKTIKIWERNNYKINL